MLIDHGGNNDNPSIKLDASSGDDDEIQLVGGTNCTITRNNDGQITFDAVNTNTQLTTEQVQDIVGAMFSGNTETRITATYQDSDGTIDLIVDDQSSDNNTTFSISAVDGDNTDEEKIRLTGANPSSTDDVVLEAGSGLSIARSGDKITFTSDGANVTTSQNPPSSPNSGDLWWDTDDGELHLYYNDGSSAQWVSAGASGEKGVKGEAGGGAPVGQIVAWSGSAGSLPDGYFLCDGSAISRTTYAALFAVVGTTHGSGNGSTTFNIPDLRDRFVVGASNSTGDTTYPGVSPGATGGNANAVVVTHDHDADATSNVSDPGHRHSSRGFGTDDDGGDQHTGSGNNSVRNNAIEDATTGINVATNIDIDDEGESGTNKNLPPYYALAYIIQYSQGGDAAKGQKGEAGNLFASGTRMLFNQTSAPTGWTKVTSGVDNRALRIVTGTVGSGGSSGFTNVLNSSVTTANGSVSNHTLTTTQLAAHFHDVWTRNESAIDGSRSSGSLSNQPQGNWYTAGSGYRQVHIGGNHYAPTSGNTGGGGSHNHGFTNPNFNLNVAYTDVIIAQKN